MCWDLLLCTSWGGDRKSRVRQPAKQVLHDPCPSPLKIWAYSKLKEMLRLLVETVVVVVWWFGFRHQDVNSWPYLDVSKSYVLIHPEIKFVVPGICPLCPCQLYTTPHKAPRQDLTKFWWYILKINELSVNFKEPRLSQLSFTGAINTFRQDWIRGIYISKWSCSRWKQQCKISTGNLLKVIV